MREIKWRLRLYAHARADCAMRPGCFPGIATGTVRQTSVLLEGGIMTIEGSKPCLACTHKFMLS